MKDQLGLNLDLISYCINLGANLNIKTNNKNTSLKILKDKINKRIIDKTQVEKYLAEIIEVIRQSCRGRNIIKFKEE